MADITLEKPPAGQNITVEAHAGARFIVKFDTSEATPKKDGANFIFSFEDGSSITITNFYGKPQSSAPELPWHDTFVPIEDFFSSTKDVHGSSFIDISPQNTLEENIFLQQNLIVIL